MILFIDLFVGKFCKWKTVIYVTRMFEHLLKMFKMSTNCYANVGSKSINTCQHKWSVIKKSIWQIVFKIFRIIENVHENLQLYVWWLYYRQLQQRMSAHFLQEWRPFDGLASLNIHRDINLDIDEVLDELFSKLRRIKLLINNWFI